MLGVFAIGISLYYTWRRIGIAEEELKTSQEGQINERFMRAIDQLGNNKMEIRLGGIYALERIALKSEYYYWPIMEILTAYVRKNSSVEAVGNKKVIHLDMDIQTNESTTSEVSEVNKISLDIQAILTVLGRRINLSKNRESNHLNLREASLEGANLIHAHFEWTIFIKTRLEGANLIDAHLESALFTEAHLEKANLHGAHLEEAFLIRANLEGANLTGTYLKGAYFEGANLEGADLRMANGLSIYQLSIAKTLYNAKLNEELEISLKENYPSLFEEPKK